MPQVRVSIPSVCIQTNGIHAPAGCLTGNVENRNLVLSAAHASGPPSADPQAPTSHNPLAGSSEEQLYVISVTSGGAHAGIGLVNQPAASTVSINSASVELCLNRTVPTTNASVPVDNNTAAAVVRAHVDLVGASTQCCPAMLWPVVATLQQLQQQQQQQTHQQLQQQSLQQGSSSPCVILPAAVDVQPHAGDLWQRRQTGNNALPDDRSHNAAVDTIQQRSTMDVDDEAIQPAAEAALGIQWELCLQISSHSHVEVLGEAGQEA